MKKAQSVFIFIFFALFSLVWQGKLAAQVGQGPAESSNLSQPEARPDGNEDEVDPKVLRDFIESRGLLECRKKCGKLTLYGDVRARWTAEGEKVEGIKKRGTDTGISVDRFKSEFNLFIDYETKNSWVSTKVKWSVLDGRDSGAVVKTDLDRAFLGYDIYECRDEDFYIEMGRSRLDYIFESRVEFGSTFDGIHLYYTNVYPGVGTLMLHGGPFVINSYTDHYGWIVEAGFKDLIAKGFSVKYSAIDWFRNAPTTWIGRKKKGGYEEGDLIENNYRYRFLVSQMIFGYEGPVNFAGCKTIYVYAAALANHLAEKSITTDWQYANKAWYTGFTLGKLCKAGDWSLDLCYQYVQAQAVPEFDMNGIGHGNADNFFFSDAILYHNLPYDAQGFNNYQGPELILLYALTDTLSFRADAAFSKPVEQKFGGDFTYKKFDFQAIYAF